MKKYKWTIVIETEAERMNAFDGEFYDGEYIKIPSNKVICIMRNSGETEESK